MLAEAHHVKPLKIPKDIPVWLDRATRALVGDIIGLLSERHPDLLAVILYGSVARHEERPLGAFNSSDVVSILAMLICSQYLTRTTHYWMSTRAIPFLIL